MSLCDASAVTIQATPQQQHQSTQSIADYLAQLLKDRKQMAAFPNVFNHVERLLDEGECSYLSDKCRRTSKNKTNNACVNNKQPKKSPVNVIST